MIPVATSVNRNPATKPAGPAPAAAAPTLAICHFFFGLGELDDEELELSLDDDDELGDEEELGLEEDELLLELDDGELELDEDELELDGDELELDEEELELELELEVDSLDSLEDDKLAADDEPELPLAPEAEDARREDDTLALERLSGEGDAEDDDTVGEETGWPTVQRHRRHCGGWLLRGCEIQTTMSTGVPGANISVARGKLTSE